MANYSVIMKTSGVGNTFFSYGKSVWDIDPNFDSKNWNHPDVFTFSEINISNEHVLHLLANAIQKIKHSDSIIQVVTIENSFINSDLVIETRDEFPTLRETGFQFINGQFIKTN